MPPAGSAGPGGPHDPSWRSPVDRNLQGPLLVSLCGNGLMLAWRVVAAVPVQTGTQGTRRNPTGSPKLQPQPLTAINLPSAPTTAAVSALATLPSSAGPSSWALGHVDGTLHVVDPVSLGTWKKQYWQLPGGAVTHLACAGDGAHSTRQLAAVMQDGTVLVQPVPLNGEQALYVTLPFDTARVPSRGRALCTAWDPHDRSLLAVGFLKGVVQVGAPAS